jgi:hypothetical protein
MLAHMTVNLVALHLRIAEDFSDRVQVTCTTPGVLKTDGVYLTKGNPYFELRLSPPLTVTSVEAEWSFAGLGVRDSTVDANAAPAHVHVVIERQDGANLLTLDVPLTFYC